MVWSPQLGAEEKHVDGAAQLIDDSRVTQYWDPTMAAGRAFEHLLGTSGPAWDVWMLFGPDARWGESPPEPDWWEHQLGGLPPDRRLDFDRFAEKALGL